MSSEGRTEQTDFDSGTAARRLIEGAPIAESTEMFEMDHGTRGARITALFSISKARALEEFSAFSHRSFVSIIARVWLQETIE